MTVKKLLQLLSTILVALVVLLAVALVIYTRSFSKMAEVLFLHLRLREE